MTSVYTITLTTLGFPHGHTLDGSPGYLMRLPTGQPAWIGKESFEADAIDLGHIDHLPEHYKHMAAQRAQVHAQLEIMAKFENSDLWHTLPWDEQSDLLEQFAALRELRGILDRRMDRFMRYRDFELARNS